MSDDSWQELDPNVASVAAELRRMGVPDWHTMSVPAARQVEDDVFTSEVDLPVGAVRDLGIDGPDDPVPIRVYRPAETPAPTLVFYHGGGWVLGTLDSADDLCRRLCRRVGAVVISVDYRLAPEHQFPDGLGDCLAALTWARANASSIGGNGRVGVVGSSAGANLAAAVALWDAREGPSDLAVQALLYPVTNHAFTTRSYERNAEAVLLTRADMRWFWNLYLRSEVDAANPYAAPMQASDDALKGLPDAVTVTAGHDPLRDDGRAYSERLRKQGADVQLMDYPSMAHGFLSLVEEVPAADEAFDDVAAAIADRLVTD